jgi:hypothetical protein
MPTIELIDAPSDSLMNRRYFLKFFFANNTKVLQARPAEELHLFPSSGIN